MKSTTRFGPLLALVKALDEAERASLLAAQRRHELPPGSSRARVTTANANHARKAEARDRKLDAAAAEAARIFHLVPASPPAAYKGLEEAAREATAGDARAAAALDLLHPIASRAVKIEHVDSD